MIQFHYIYIFSLCLMIMLCAKKLGLMDVPTFVLKRIGLSSESSAQRCKQRLDRCLRQDD
jgi:hypothetical protein